MKVKLSLSKHVLNMLVGAIVFGYWQHSILAGMAFYSFLAILADPEK